MNRVNSGFGVFDVQAAANHKRALSGEKECGLTANTPTGASYNADFP